MKFFKFTDFFKNLLFPHLWLDLHIEPFSAALIAGGSLLGGAAAGGLFGGGSEGPGISDIRVGAGGYKSELLGGIPKFGLPAIDIGTPNSSLNAGAGRVSIDPSIRERSISALDRFTGSLTDSRSALASNQSAFNQARVAPLMDRLTRGRGALERELGQTGVRGTFRNRSLQDFDIGAERELGNARAIAEQESLNAINVIDQLIFNAGAGTSTDLFNQEMAQLGFGLESINVINTLANNLAVGAGNIASSSAGNAAVVNQARSENITGLIGAGLTAFGQSGGGSTTAPSSGGLTSYGQNIFK